MAIQETDGLPSCSFFTRLLCTARKIGKREDSCAQYAINTDYDQLLRDTVAFRKIIRKKLPSGLLGTDGICLGEDCRIALFGEASYDTLIAICAVLAMGGVITPLDGNAAFEVTMDLIQDYRPVAIISGPEYASLVTRIQETQPCGNISLRWEDENLPTDYSPWIDERIVFSPRRPTFVLSTSGTTGRRKGVIQTAERLTVNCLPSGSCEDTFLLRSPIYHGQGFTGLLSGVLQGILVEVRDRRSLSAEGVWERLAEGGLTILIGPTGLWLQLMEYFHAHIIERPSSDQQRYLVGVKSLRSAICAATMPTIAIKQFWDRLLGDVSLQVAYGSMETGAISSTSPESGVTSECSIGKAEPGVTIKLSKGDHGDMLVKSPSMFLGYLGDPLHRLLDAQGFWRTGDIAHLQGQEFILDGRAKTDFIYTINSKISALEVEMALQNLPYITDACVLAVPDAAVRYRVACLLRCSGKQSANLARIRSDLLPVLDAFKMPTLLRCLGEGEVIPRTGTEKVLRSEAGLTYFPQVAHGDTASLPRAVEVMELGGLFPLASQRGGDRG